jgi:predicted N-acetyltransferase YhbS
MRHNMGTAVHQYKRSLDFHRVGQFLVDTYQVGTHHENWLQPRWEYMHYHPDLDEAALGRIGLWESDGKVVAVAHYELALGEAFFQVHRDFAYLKPEMLEYAEAHLSLKADNGRRKIVVWVNDFDTGLESLVRARGYQLVEGAKECWSVLEITDPFPPINLPVGFRLQSLQDENDLNKLDRVVYRGFDHPGEPPRDGVAGKKKMQSAPNYRKDLNIIAVAPDGTYAAYCGMWQDHVNKVAYVEPVCTDPDYRCLGLGTAVVLEGIRRCGLEGARIAMVGSEQPFYLSMGFKKLFDINLWTRWWEV